MGSIGAPEIILVLLVLILLFGAKKLPELARSTGRSLRIFKSETKGLMEDDDQPAPPAPTGPQAIEPAQIVEASPVDEHQPKPDTTA